jgi:hypothetical protein
LFGFCCVAEAPLPHTKVPELKRISHLFASPFVNKEVKNLLVLELLVSLE